MLTSGFNTRRIATRALALVAAVAIAAPYLPSVRAATGCACVAAAFGLSGSHRACCAGDIATEGTTAPDADVCCCCDEQEASAAPRLAESDAPAAPGPNPAHPRHCGKLCACGIASSAVAPRAVEFPVYAEPFRLASSAPPALAIGPAPLRHFRPPR